MARNHPLGTPIRETELAKAEKDVELYGELEALADGESIILWAPEQGPEQGYDPKRWCQARMKSFDWARKQRVHAAESILSRSGEFLSSDYRRRLDGISAIEKKLVQDEDGRWGVRFTRQEAYRITKVSKDGQRQDYVLGPKTGDEE